MGPNVACIIRAYMYSVGWLWHYMPTSIYDHLVKPITLQRTKKSKFLVVIISIMKVLLQISIALVLCFYFISAELPSDYRNCGKKNIEFYFFLNL